MTIINIPSNKTVLKNVTGRIQDADFFQQSYVLQADGSYRIYDKIKLEKDGKLMIWKEIFENEVLFELYFELNVSEASIIKIHHQPKEITSHQQRTLNQVLKHFKRKSYKKPSFEPSLSPVIKSGKNSFFNKSKTFFKSTIGSF